MKEGLFKKNFLDKILTDSQDQKENGQEPVSDSKQSCVRDHVDSGMVNNKLIEQFPLIMIPNHTGCMTLDMCWTSFQANTLRLIISE